MEYPRSRPVTSSSSTDAASRHSPEEGHEAVGQSWLRKSHMKKDRIDGSICEVFKGGKRGALLTNRHCDVCFDCATRCRKCTIEDPMGCPTIFNALDEYLRSDFPTEVPDGFIVKQKINDLANSGNVRAQQVVGYRKQAPEKNILEYYDRTLKIMKWMEGLQYDVPTDEKLVADQLRGAGIKLTPKDKDDDVQALYVLLAKAVIQQATVLMEFQEELHKLSSGDEDEKVGGIANRHKDEKTVDDWLVGKKPLISALDRQTYAKALKLFMARRGS